MIPVTIPHAPSSREQARWFLSKFTNTYGTQFTNIENDYAALWQLIDTYDCRSVLEIGTWEGYATLFMWLHPNIEAAAAVDVCVPGTGHHQGIKPEDYGRYFRYTTPAKLIVGNSNDIAVEKAYDLVFVDGEHSLRQAANDLVVAKRAARKVVAFHDWKNGNPGVDDMITVSTEQFKVIEGTSVAFFEV